MMDQSGDGIVYTFSESDYTDAGQDITVEIVTQPMDMEIIQRKQMSSLFVEADTQNTTISVSYTDDDYQNFSTPRSISLNQPRKFLRRLGSFYTRAFKITHTDNTPLRLMSLEIPVDAFPTQDR